MCIRREALQLLHFCALHRGLLRWHPDACQLSFSNRDPTPLANWARSTLLLILRRVKFKLLFFNPLSHGCCPDNRTQFFYVAKSNRCFFQSWISSELNVTDHKHLHFLLLVPITIHFPSFFLSVNFLLLGFLIKILHLFLFYIYVKEFNEYLCLHCLVL